MRFLRREPRQGIPKSKRCAMALRVDFERRVEHILIGEADAIRALDKGRNTDKIWVDERRPLGTLIEEVRTGVLPDIRNIAVELLDESDMSGNALEELYRSSNIVHRYIALRLLQESKYGNKDEKLNRMEEIVLPASISLTESILKWQDWRGIGMMKNTFSQHLLHGEMQCIYLPEEGTELCEEYRLIETSVLPLIAYYLHAAYARKEYLRHCKVCGSVFATKTHRSTLCSRECREVQKRKNQEVHSEKIEGDEAEQRYINARAFWRYRLKRIREDSDCSKMRIRAVEEAYDLFRKEALAGKKKVKSGEMSLQVYSDFLFEEERKLEKFFNQQWLVEARE